MKTSFAVFAAAVVGLAAPLAAQDAKPGSMLKTGMILVYSSNGSETPWSIDSLSADTTLGSRTGCVRFRLRMSPTAPQATRAFCSDTAFLHAWDERASQLRQSRPLRPGVPMESRAPSGNVSTYEAGPEQVERIGGVAVTVIPTVVTTRDSTGRIIRRLRERFSLALLTATGGVFEAPDSASATGWRTQQAFELVAIR